MHLGLALLALLLGAVQLATRKGTPLHRVRGGLYIVLMCGVNGLALAIYEESGRVGPFHVLAVLSLVTLGVALQASVPRGDRHFRTHQHAFWMAGSYVGLVAAGLFQLATHPGPIPQSAALSAATVLTIVVAASLFLRVVPRELASSHGWPI